MAMGASFIRTAIITSEIGWTESGLGMVGSWIKVVGCMKANGSIASSWENDEYFNSW